MARFARAVAVGVVHHVTQRGVDRQRVLFTDTDRRTYQECHTHSGRSRRAALAGGRIAARPRPLSAVLQRASEPLRPSLAEPFLLLPARPTASLDRPELCRAESGSGESGKTGSKTGTSARFDCRLLNH